MTTYNKKKESGQLLITTDEELRFLGVQSSLQLTEKNDQRYLAEIRSERADTFDDALVKLAHSRYDVLIMCVQVSEGKTPEMIERVKKKSPETRILVMGDCFRNEDVDAAMRVGASGYVEQSIRSGELKDLIYKAYHGSRRGIYSNKVAQLKLNESDPLYGIRPETPKKGTLTNRELQVLQSMAGGKSTKEMSVILAIVESTVETHRRSIIRKLHASNSNHAVRIGIERGYVPIYNPRYDGLHG